VKLFPVSIQKVTGKISIHTVMLVGILIIAACARYYGLDRQSFSYDEFIEETAFEIQFLEPDSNKFLIVNPPLNSFFIYVMKNVFPSSDLALRFVPFLFGSVTVFLMYLFGRALYGERTGLLASFLLAISPLHIWYSQDIRMYSLQWMLGILSFIFFLRALEKPVLKNYIGYIASIVAGLYTLQLTLFIIMIQGLYLILSFNKYREQFYKWMLVFAITVLLYLPWVIFTLKLFVVTGKQAGFAKPTDLRVFLYTLYTFCAGFSIGPSLKELHLDSSYSVVRPYTAEILLVMSIFITVFSLGFWSLWKDRQKSWLTLLLLIIPILGVFLLNKIIPNLTYNIRYVGMSLFGFLLVLACGIEHFLCLISRVAGKILAVLALISILGISAYSYANYHLHDKYHKEDIRGAVDFIKERKTNEDHVICIVHAEVFNRYSKGNPTCAGFPSIAINNKDKVDEIMRIRVKGKNRLWLVLIRDWTPNMGNLGNDIKEWLDMRYDKIESMSEDGSEIANIKIYSYDLTNKGKLMQNTR
jgi:hypothetical protein